MRSDDIIADGETPYAVSALPSQNRSLGDEYGMVRAVVVDKHLQRVGREGRYAEAVGVSDVRPAGNASVWVRFDDPSGDFDHINGHDRLIRAHDVVGLWAEHVAIRQDRRDYFSAVLRDSLDIDWNANA